MLTAKITMDIKRGDVFRHELAGAGGWGDPLERDPDRVLKDVRNDFVGAASARDDYGVVVDTRNWTVDVAATERRRAELRRARNWSEVPTVLWENSPKRPRAAT